MAVDCICDAYTPHLFDSIADFYLTTDLPTANLESTVYPAAPFGRNQPKVLPGQTRTDCNPRMNTSAGMLDRFVNAGIRYFSTANNHCYDYDEAGLLATLDELDRRGAAHSGTNRSPQEQTQALVLDVGGVRVAELSATFDLNDRAYEKKWLLNEVRFNDTPCDFTLIEQLIASAKAQKADIITLHAHWGWEFELYPHPKTVEYAHKLAEMGVDVIVGTHPHVSQPMEKYTYTQNGEQRSCLIFYSLGDFVSFHPQSRDSRITYVPRYTLAKGELDGRPRTFVTGLQILPVYILTAADAEENYDVRLLRFPTCWRTDRMQTAHTAIPSASGSAPICRACMKRSCTGSSFRRITGNCSYHKEASDEAHKDLPAAVSLGHCRRKLPDGLCLSRLLQQQ